MLPEHRQGVTAAPDDDELIIGRLVTPRYFHPRAPLEVYSSVELGLEKHRGRLFKSWRWWAGAEVGSLVGKSKRNSSSRIQSRLSLTVAAGVQPVKLHRRCVSRVTKSTSMAGFLDEHYARKG